MVFFQTILFTTDEDILEKISRHDDSFDSLMNDVNNDTFMTKQPERPLTADVGVSYMNHLLFFFLIKHFSSKV